MHAWVVYHREVLHTPLRPLAAEIGISKTALDQFHKLHSHPGKLWPRLRDWYMRTRNTRIDEYQTPPEELLASALHALSQVPGTRRSEVLRSAVEFYNSAFAGMPIPEWVRMLEDLADREQNN